MPPVAVPGIFLADKRLRHLPTAATRSPPCFRHRRRSGRSPQAGSFVSFLPEQERHPPEALGNLPICRASSSGRAMLTPTATNGKKDPRNRGSFFIYIGLWTDTGRRCPAKAPPRSCRDFPLPPPQPRGALRRRKCPPARPLPYPSAGRQHRPRFPLPG